MIPTIGRVVHYVPESGKPWCGHKPVVIVDCRTNHFFVEGEHFNDWEHDRMTVDLHLFGYGLLPAVPYDVNKSPFTWHWPE